MDIEQFITQLLKNKSEELEEFKSYIKEYKIEDKSSYNEWIIVYLSWMQQREEPVENMRKIPKILLSDD
ncbi:hypothetical protein LCGC14_1093150 [marine sediment metagenome]|uniref:Uncharacterized protein n=1 Tax=marine sediment metagenome TaxID=412755 RepID=A0A0F9MBV7_9ZZZZ